MRYRSHETLMLQELPPVPVRLTDGALTAAFKADLASAAGYAWAEKATATRRAYQADFRDFAA